MFASSHQPHRDLSTVRSQSDSQFIPIHSSRKCRNLGASGEEKLHCSTRLRDKRHKPKSPQELWPIKYKSCMMGEIATDGTKLFVMRPSPHSTNEPTPTNQAEYGTLDDTMRQSCSTASFEMLLSDESKRDSSPGFWASVWHAVRGRPARAAVLTVSTVVLAFIFASFSKDFPGVPSVMKHSGKTGERAPYSTLDPVADMGLYALVRPQDSSPPDSVLPHSRHKAIPTNTWYQNMLMAKGEPTDVHRVYSMPYVVDVAGPIPGLRVHPNHIDASTTVVQLSYVDSYGITLGAAPDRRVPSKALLSKRYSVVSTTSLAVTLQWKALPMSASIVKGMPYATMHYPKPLQNSSLLPSVASELKLATAPVADGKTKIVCHSKATRVESELKLNFEASDFTWLVFFSEPVMLQCVEDLDGTAVVFQIVELVEPNETAELLTIRAALLTNCTHGQNHIYCLHKESSSHIEKYETLLRERANLYPGPLAEVRYDIEYEQDEAVLKFDWDVRDMKAPRMEEGATDDSMQNSLRHDPRGDDNELDLIAYALPHHLNRMSTDLMPWGDDRFCTALLIGTSCVVSGSHWELVEDLPPIAFQAPRPPRPEAISVISKALKNDLSIKLDDYYVRGAGDTYFSGKMLSKLARVLLIAEELKGLCNSHNQQDLGYVLTSEAKEAYTAACQDAFLPTDNDMSALVSRLRSYVEVWINGTADIPFVYDSAWGGVISCGCLFDSQTMSCSNQFPHCPSISDPGLNFGNGFYNDHHFHYGYHIYAAAAVAHFDHAWGRQHFDQVLLLIRDIANPSDDDIYFPRCRQKDWYQGNSWASGVPLPPYLNGKNQESSSEAIAAYEAVTLFGQEMMKAWKSDNNKHGTDVASHIRDVGRLLTATEVRSADYYWHVRQHNESMKMYPPAYTQNAIGMLWNTMAQFQTWFGGASFLAIGIQLLPLTAISESRDKPDWVREMYPAFAESCGSVDTCEKQGWSILQLATLASVGHINLAMERAQKIPRSVFDTAGGNGHSLTNTLWFMATRPNVEPIPLSEEKKAESSTKKAAKLVDCGVPDTCTEKVLDTDAKGSSCRARIYWLMSTMGYSEARACHRVAGGEFPKTCGLCDPGVEAEGEDTDENKSQCPPCTKEECLSDLNRCPRYDTTFVCIVGRNAGGCSPEPWDLGTGQCSKCCEVTVCIDYENLEPDEAPRDFGSAKPNEPPQYSEDDITRVSECGKCAKDICSSKLNLCPANSAPYLCVEGKNARGCSPWPWPADTGECDKCCDLNLTCSQ